VRILLAVCAAYLKAAGQGAVQGAGFRLTFPRIGPPTSGFVRAAQRRPPRRCAAAAGGAYCHETQCGGSRNLPWRVARVAPWSTARRRPCERDFGRVFARVFARRGPPTPGTPEISHAVSRRRPAPTRWADPNPPGPAAVIPSTRNQRHRRYRWFDRRPSWSTACLHHRPQQTKRGPISGRGRGH